MIDDAMAGKIDLILTKSISRFARNTVDMLTTVRRLKERNVEVQFEKEHISTLDSSGELMITILSSLSQEESHNISENIKWSISNYFANGNVMMGYGHFLGYEKGEDGRPRVVEEQAKVVREIYQQFLTGASFHRIARLLTERGVPTPSGKKSAWNSVAVKSILQNEKYCGSALLQKYYVPNFLAKRVIPNDGAKPKYFVENSHEAIISQEMFDLVQHEIEKRRGAGRGGCYGYKNVFSRRVFCGECGGLYTPRKVLRRKAERGTLDGDRETVWRCGRKYERKGVSSGIPNMAEDFSIAKKIHSCATPTVREAQLRTGFVETLNSLLCRKEAVLAEYDREIAALSDQTSLVEEKARREAEIAQAKAELADFAMDTTAAQGGAEHPPMARYKTLMKQVENAQTRLEAIEAQSAHQKNRKIALALFSDDLKAQDGPIRAFDKALWMRMVERVVICKDDSGDRFTPCVNCAEIPYAPKRYIAEYHYKDGRVISWAIR